MLICPFKNLRPNCYNGLIFINTRINVYIHAYTYLCTCTGLPKRGDGDDEDDELELPIVIDTGMYTVKV